MSWERNNKLISDRSGSSCQDFDFFPWFFRMKNMFTLSETMVVPNHYSDHEVLGCFGVTVHYFITNGAYSKNTKVAIKAVRTTDHRMNKHAKTELEVVKQIKHPNIANHYAYFRAGNRIFNIMEFVPDGTLGRYIKSNSNISYEHLAKMFFQILDAIKYLHMKLIAHRDIKDENIVLKFNDGSAPTPKLCDFGFAIQLTTPFDLCTNYCGTKSFKAPELLHAEGPYNPFKSEIWALGILLHKMIIRKVPQYCQEKRKIQIEWGCFPKRVVDLLNRMIRIEPDERADAETLVSHRWFKEAKRVLFQN